MKVIVCLDNNNGLMFNRRRQSRDSNIIRDIAETINGATLRVAPYSASLFSGTLTVNASDDFLSGASDADYCFVENVHLFDYKNDIEELIVYKWNRDYPADLYFDIDYAKEYQLRNSTDFVGTSHDKITKEVYSA